MITHEDIEAFSDSQAYYNELPEGRKPLTMKELQVKSMSFEDHAQMCHKASYNNGWWHDPDTGEELPTEGFLGAHVIGCKIGLINSEVSEIMEGHRKQKMDDKLPHYKAMDVEIVDTLIRLLDLAGKVRTPITSIYLEKMSFNDVRPDHTLENRKKGGKLY